MRWYRIRNTSTGWAIDRWRLVIWWQIGWAATSREALASITMQSGDQVIVQETRIVGS